MVPLLGRPIRSYTFASMPVGSGLVVFQLPLIFGHQVNSEVLGNLFQVVENSDVVALVCLDFSGQRTTTPGVVGKREPRYHVVKHIQHCTGPIGESESSAVFGNI